MKYQEIERDLFVAPAEWKLAHCISADCAMGAGIAVLFAQRYQAMRRAIRRMNPIVGKAYQYDRVFNLVTKEYYWNKPTYHTLSLALDSLHEQCKELGIKKLAMPAIGCGLDKLDWSLVSKMIQGKFSDLDIHIVICFKGRK